jgi:hypothetical protein
LLVSIEHWRKCYVERGIAIVSGRGWRCVWSILWASNDEFDNNEPRGREWDDGDREWIDDYGYYSGDEFKFDGSWGLE